MLPLVSFMLVTFLLLASLRIDQKEVQDYKALLM